MKLSAALDRCVNRAPALPMSGMSKSAGPSSSMCVCRSLSPGIMQVGSRVVAV